MPRTLPRCCFTSKALRQAGGSRQSGGISSLRRRLLRHRGRACCLRRPHPALTCVIRGESQRQNQSPGLRAGGDRRPLSAQLRHSPAINECGRLPPNPSFVGAAVRLRLPLSETKTRPARFLRSTTVLQKRIELIAAKRSKTRSSFAASPTPSWDAEGRIRLEVCGIMSLEWNALSNVSGARSQVWRHSS